MGQDRARATEHRQTRLPCKATRPLSQNYFSKGVIKLSSPTAAKTMHTADGKHPARYSSYSRESATPYVRKSALKSGVRRYNL